MLSGTLHFDLPIGGKGKGTPITMVKRKGGIARRKGSGREGYPSCVTAATVRRGKIRSRLRAELRDPRSVPGRVPGRGRPDVNLGTKGVPNHPARHLIWCRWPSRRVDIRAQDVGRWAGEASALRVRGTDACYKRGCQ